jgi:hypothetical protein
MLEDIELSKDDVITLKSIVNSTINTLSKFPELDNKLGLSDKFLGPLGEAIALLKIFELHGKNAKYSWFGKFKKDYDLVVIENGRHIKYQIKSSAHAHHFLFRVIECSFGKDASQVANEIKNRDLKKILKAIDDTVDSQDVDYWLLTYLKKEGNKFYRLDKEALKSVAKQHYVNYFNNITHRESTNYGVSQKSGSYLVMLQGKRKGDPELLEPYRI